MNSLLIFMSVIWICFTYWISFLVFIQKGKRTLLELILLLLAPIALPMCIVWAVIEMIYEKINE